MFKKYGCKFSLKVAMCGAEWLLLVLPYVLYDKRLII